MTPSCIISSHSSSCACTGTSLLFSVSDVRGPHLQVGQTDGCCAQGWTIQVFCLGFHLSSWRAGRCCQLPFCSMASTRQAWMMFSQRAAVNRGLVRLRNTMLTPAVSTEPLTAPSCPYLRLASLCRRAAGLRGLAAVSTTAPTVPANHAGGESHHHTLGGFWVVEHQRRPPPTPCPATRSFWTATPAVRPLLSLLPLSWTCNTSPCCPFSLPNFKLCTKLQKLNNGQTVYVGGRGS